MARRLEVVIAGDTADFDRAIDRAGKKTSSFGSKLGSLAKGGAIGAAVGGVALLGKSLFDSVGKAKEAEKAQARLEAALDSAGVSYAKHGDAIDKAIQKTSKLAALDDEELSDSFAKIVRTTGDVSKATEGMALAADIARARNISLEAATKTVEKGLLGNTAAFKKVGVEIEKGTTATEAFEKAQAQFAGAAKAHGETAAGAQEKLGVAFENLQEKIGEKLLPVLAKLAVKLTDLITWAEDNWPKFKTAMDPVFDAAKIVIDNFIDKIKAIVEAVKGVIKIIKGIKDGDWATVWDGIKQVAVDGIGGMVTAMVALPAKILAALGKKAWAGLSAVGGFISDAILSGVSAIGTAIKGFLIGGINDAIDLLNKVIALFNKIPLLPDIPQIARLGGDTKAPSGLEKFPDKRAAGGPVTAGTPYIVGERGRELFVPGQSGRIIPNGRMAMAGGGPTYVFNFPNYVGNKDELMQVVRAETAKYERANGALA